MRLSTSTTLSGLLAVALIAPVRAATELSSIRFSADIHQQLPAPGGGLTTATDHSISDFDLGIGSAINNDELGDLGAADIDAYHNSGDNCGDAIFSVDILTEINAVVMSPADVFSANGNKVLDAAALGLPLGRNLDALSRDPASCDVVFSMDGLSLIDGVTYQADDLIRWNPMTGFSLYRAMGLGNDIDALHLLDNGNILFSVAVDQALPGLNVQDEDVVELILSTNPPQYDLAFAPSSFNNSWFAGDLDALWAMRMPQPGSLRWTLAELEVFEDVGSFDLFLERVNGSDGAVSLNWTTMPGSASENVDYMAANGTVSFADGVTGASVNIRIINDMLLERNEDFFVRITMVSGGATLGSPNVVQVTIRDDEDYIFEDSFES